MKDIIKVVLCLGLLVIISGREIKAVNLNDIQVQKEINVLPVELEPQITITEIAKPEDKVITNPLPLITKTQVPIIIPQRETTTSLTPTSAETEIREETEPEIKEVKEVVEEKVEEEKVEEVEKTNSDKWFWIIIISLLALILGVQIWSTKKAEERDKNKDL